MATDDHAECYKNLKAAKRGIEWLDNFHRSYRRTEGCMDMKGNF